MIDTLSQAAAHMGISLTAAQGESLLKLLNELNDWNQRINLTAIRDLQQQLSKHLLDSLSIQPFLRGRYIADIGTGAGFPGLPLAVINPDKEFLLIDSINKKLRFVEHAAAVMQLQNVAVLHTRAQDYRPTRLFDVVVSRAMGSIENFVLWCGHLCAPQGRLLAMKGRYPDEELATVPKGWRVVAVHELKIPGLDEQRHLVELCRT